MTTQQLTKQWFKDHNACNDGYKWVCEQFKNTDTIKSVDLINKLIQDDQLNWANWTITKVFTHHQCVQYSIFAAELVLCNYENYSPDDNRPRKAIEAAKEYLANPTEDNRQKARFAAESARSARSAESARSARSARSAESARSARSAEFAAWSAAESAEFAAWSAAESAESAARSARSAEFAAWSAANNTKKKILEYGIKLLQEAK